jgi:ornithine cyclodeaminase/alanine dehydrogenase-like protein (mu-crystallin family)
MSKTRILGQADVRRLLPMGECVDLMARALTELSAGRAVNPLRSAMKLPDGSGLLGLMPGYVEQPQALGLKVVAVFPGNHGTRYDSHQGLVVLFDTQHGCPLAIMDASEVTAIRTAAATGVATRALAREDATTLALIGSGTQARTHLEAMLSVRPLKSVRVFSPNADRRQAFAKVESQRHGIPVLAVDSAQDAVADADIVCTTTSSSEPVIRGEWLAPGTHVNAVGASVPWAREVDTPTVVRSRLFVDRRESTENESGAYRTALAEGAITADHIQGEIGEILLGKIPGRCTADEITLFKSLGVAVEDLLAADHVLRRAQEENVGIEVELGGLRDVAD